MKIYSEITKKEYKNVEECLKEEAIYKEEEDKKKKEKEKLSLEKKTRAQEVSNAYAAINEAQKNYNRLLKEFIKDYSSFHMTFVDEEEIPRLSLMEMFNLFP